MPRFLSDVPGAAGPRIAFLPVSCGAGMEGARCTPTCLLTPSLNLLPTRSNALSPRCQIATQPTVHPLAAALLFSRPVSGTRSASVSSSMMLARPMVNWRCSSSMGRVLRKVTGLILRDGDQGRIRGIQMETFFGGARHDCSRLVAVSHTILFIGHTSDFASPKDHRARTSPTFRSRSQRSFQDRLVTLTHHQTTMKPTLSHVGKLPTRLLAFEMYRSVNFLLLLLSSCSVA